VVETLRPLPVRSFSGSPDFVTGVAILRGRPTAVVDLGMLLGERGPTVASRYVTLRVGARHLALAVEAVLGIRNLDESTLHPLPPVLKDLDDQLVERIGALDSELLVVLRASRILPHEVWRSVTPEAPLAHGD
jgi:purine-binding chemotaxis protein CheW